LKKRPFYRPSKRLTPKTIWPTAVTNWIYSTFNRTVMDRTLKPALDEFGLKGLRLIDPACGSGHFLLEAFGRLFPMYASSDAESVVAAQNALDCVVGVDLNPYAVAIARFRLLIAALCACGIRRLSAAPDWNIHLATGDSLLFGPHNENPRLWSLPSEDPDRLERYLRVQEYHIRLSWATHLNTLY
jgi:hypothetical protein